MKWLQTNTGAQIWFSEDEWGEKKKNKRNPSYTIKNESELYSLFMFCSQRPPLKDFVHEEFNFHPDTPSNESLAKKRRYGVHACTSSSNNASWVIPTITDNVSLNVTFNDSTLSKTQLILQL